MPFALTCTDLFQPSHDSAAGRDLAQNLQTLARLRGRDEAPEVRKDVDIFDTRHDELLSIASCVLAGSPAPQDPEGRRGNQSAPGDNVRFKENAFYSLCWRTTADTVVAMTWSLSACRRLEFWADAPCSRRCLVVARATFGTYRPRRGCASDLSALADEADTMLTLFLRPELLDKLVIVDDVLDGAATLAALASHGKQHLVTYSCYTCELELDVVKKDTTHANDPLDEERLSRGQTRQLELDAVEKNTNRDNEPLDEACLSPGPVRRCKKGRVD